MPNLAPWEQEEQELWKKQEQAQTISADEPVASDVAAVSDPVPWEQDEQERWQPQKKNIDQPVAEDAFVPEKPQSTRRFFICSAVCAADLCWVGFLFPDWNIGC
jgi:hypothetical protein